MAYDLPEMTVNSRDHQVLHLTGYVREYSTLSTYTDTVLLFFEKTVDFMIPAKNIKNYKGWSLPAYLLQDLIIILQMPMVSTVSAIISINISHGRIGLGSSTAE